VEFEQLFDEVYPSLFRYCQRLTGDPDVADDLAQEAFVRLFDRQVEGEPPALRVWLFKVATHLLRDRARQADNRRRLLTENPVLPAAPVDPAREVEQDDVVRRVRGVLEGLDERDRTLLLMREEGFSYREIAEAVEVAPGSVGTLLARAQRRFTDEYTAQGYGNAS
jgi:RNA polymerase sigma factor (sigma-70 family)